MRNGAVNAVIMPMKIMATLAITFAVLIGLCRSRAVRGKAEQQTFQQRIVDIQEANDRNGQHAQRPSQ